MARQRSDEKRLAILEAATDIIAVQGLSATTAGIAKKAGIAIGSFFTYFETKAELLNQLYLELKREMAREAMKDFPEEKELREQAHHVWRNWMHYATSYPNKRRALMQLSVSEEITAETRAAAMKTMAGFLEQMERLRCHGPLRSASRTFAGAIMTSLAEATMNSMIQEPELAADHCEIGFEAFWRAIT
jgi:AcrR family transcriptional regulator